MQYKKSYKMFFKSVYVCFIFYLIVIIENQEINSDLEEELFGTGIGQELNDVSLKYFWFEKIEILSVQCLRHISIYHLFSIFTDRLFETCIIFNWRSFEIISSGTISVEKFNFVIKSERSKAIHEANKSQVQNIFKAHFKLLLSLSKI